MTVSGDGINVAARLEQHVRHEVRDGRGYGWNNHNGGYYDRDRDGRPVPAWAMVAHAAPNMLVTFASSVG